jgi:hypothetical protein
MHLLAVRQLFTLSGIACLDVLRQPITLLLMVTCTVLTILNPMLVIYPFGEVGKLPRDSALAFHLVFGVFVAACGACTTLSREIESGTASAVLSKPVSRETFFFSKFLGMVAVITVYSLCSILATQLNQLISHELREHALLALLPLAPILGLFVAGVVNYTTQRPYVTLAFVCVLICLAVTTGTLAYGMHAGFEWRIVPANVLIALALMVLAAIAITLSTRLQTVPTIIICTAILMLGLVSDFLFGRFTDDSWWGIIPYLLLPNWQHFWVTDGLTGGGSVPWAYVLDAGAYAVLYAAGVLAVGTLFFRTTDVQ